jgi:hypothetical protein
MADYLVNMAMGERKTTEINLTDSTSRHALRLSALLHNDLAHYAGPVPPATTALASIKSTLGVSATIPEEDSTPPGRPTKRYKTDVATKLPPNFQVGVAHRRL